MLTRDSDWYDFFKNASYAVIGGAIGAVFGIAASNREIPATNILLTIFTLVLICSIFMIFINKIFKKNKGKEEKKTMDDHPHFAKVINYAPNEPWRTDILFGQKGSSSHGHMATSGAAIWHLRDEQGKEYVKEGRESKT